MLFRTQIAVGAFLLSAALGGAEIVGEQALEQEERELMPFGYGQGFGYTTRSNRFSSPRTRGREQGSAYMRPNPYKSIFNAYNPSEEESSPSTKSSKRGSTRVNKAYKTTKRGGVPAEPAELDEDVVPSRGRSYLGSMHWQRVPGQPIFVSTTDVPIIVLDEQPTVVIDDNGETILVDSDGNEIIISVDENGDPIVETSAPTDSPTETVV